MHFDPLSTWLVVLISDGLIVSSEKSKSKVTMSEYNQKVIKQSNGILNGQIRRIKEKYGVHFPETAYEQIKQQIEVTKHSYSFQYAHGYVVIDLDNQEYIIELLDACSKYYSDNSESSEEYLQKAEWYTEAAIEARKKKEIYAKELEETRIRKEKERAMSNVYLVIGLTIFVLFILFFFS